MSFKDPLALVFLIGTKIDIALLDSVVPVHRHSATSETVVVLRGRVVEEFYSSDGAVEAAYEVSAGGPVCALNIPAGTWHTLRSLESGTVILEMKDGAYEPVAEYDILRY